MSSGKRMGVGIIGCGGFCRGNHIPNLQNNPNMEIRALCDLRLDSLSDLQESCPSAYLTDEFEKIMTDPDIGMVVCATKPDSRLPIMRSAVKNRKPLFVEKPLAFSPEDTDEMYALMKKASAPFMVGFNRPFSPMMRDAKSYYRKFFQDGTVTILFRIVGEARLWPKSHYDAVMHHGESTIIHELTHIFNLLDWLVGSHPTSVYTVGGENTDNIITLTYPGKVSAVIVAGDNSSAGFPKEYLEINGNYSTLAGYHFVELDVKTSSVLQHRHLYPYHIGQEVFTTDRAEMEARLWEFRKSITQKELDYGYYYDRQIHVDKGHYAELEAFRECIEYGTASPIDVTMGVNANRIAWTALESLKKGTHLKPDVIESGF